QANQLSLIDGLVIPGGESTTMLKLLRLENLFEPLRQFGLAKPIFGTCAGAILLASEVLHPQQESLGLMDMTVERNAYGRQVHSHVSHLQFPDQTDLEAVFIRAPIIRRAGPGVKTLASHDGTPVLVEQGRHLAATFHPELTADRRLQTLFLEKMKACRD
ncbi:MAG: pyridoxal 5'-phosphate synthase glutaminase subunit PdxT, partial [Bryobacterales bacterium]|nr:pyridoxal 5'-phosphate synthase glutaminase subunit PdxT [Bryobacterales bacterium]